MMPGPGMIDTDEKRRVVRQLTDAIYQYLTMDCDMHERLALPSLPDPAEQLARAVDDRDIMVSRLEKAREQMQDAPEIMHSSLEMAIITPMEQNLQHQEDYISRLQKQMEKSSVTE